MKKKFTDYTKLFMLIPAALVLAALILNLAGHGLNLGIDFTGGSLLEYAVGEEFNTEDVVDILRHHGYTDAQVAKAASGDDGTGAMTNLQIRLSLTDLSDDMKKLVKQAAEAEGLTDETITNLTAAYVSENELDSSYSGGYLFSWKKLANSDKLQDAVKDALDENRIPYTVVKAEELDNDAENPETRVIVVLNDQSSAVRSVLEAEMSSRYPNFTYVSIEHAGAVSSADLVRNALLSLAIALALMLVYIGFRFDLYSGVAALFGLVHDVLMMLAFMTFFRSLYQVSSSFIAAILTIVGYSINNTIIIFDRIRETKEARGHVRSQQGDRGKQRSRVPVPHDQHHADHAVHAGGAVCAGRGLDSRVHLPADRRHARRFLFLQPAERPRLGVPDGQGGSPRKAEGQGLISQPHDMGTRHKRRIPIFFHGGQPRR